MSTLKVVIAALKTADYDVVDIVGENGIHAIAAPQEAAKPYLVVNMVGEPDIEMVAGPARYYEGRIQIDCVAADRLVAVDLGQAVKNQIGGIVKASIAGASDVDIYADGVDMTDVSDDRSSFRRVIGFYVRWR